MFHKVFSIAMAFLVLFSTASFKVEKHYCGGILIDTAVFSQAQKCKMEAFEMGQTSITKKSCCKDVYEVIKGQDQLKLSKFEDLHLDQQYFVVVPFVYSFNDLFVNLEQQIVPHKDYSPPILVSDVQVLDQVFII